MVLFTPPPPPATVCLTTTGSPGLIHTTACLMPARTAHTAHYARAFLWFAVRPAGLPALPQFSLLTRTCLAFSATFPFLPVRAACRSSRTCLYSAADARTTTRCHYASAAVELWFGCCVARLPHSAINPCLPLLPLAHTADGCRCRTYITAGLLTHTPLPLTHPLHIPTAFSPHCRFVPKTFFPLLGKDSQFPFLHTEYCQFW